MYIFTYFEHRLRLILLAGFDSFFHFLFYNTLILSTLFFLFLGKANGTVSAFTTGNYPRQPVCKGKEGKLH